MFLQSCKTVLSEIISEWRIITIKCNHFEVIYHWFSSHFYMFPWIYSWHPRVVMSKKLKLKYLRWAVYRYDRCDPWEQLKNRVVNNRFWTISTTMSKNSFDQLNAEDLKVFTNLSAWHVSEKRRSIRHFRSLPISGQSFQIVCIVFTERFRNNGKLQTEWFD